MGLIEVFGYSLFALLKSSMPVTKLGIYIVQGRQINWCLFWNWFCLLGGDVEALSNEC